MPASDRQQALWMLWNRSVMERLENTEKEEENVSVTSSGLDSEGETSFPFFVVDSYCRCDNKVLLFSF